MELQKLEDKLKKALINNDEIKLNKIYISSCFDRNKNMLCKKLYSEGFLDHHQDNAEVKTFLGYIYSYGFGAEKDYEKAKEMYEQAAKMGSRNAINNLGYIYQKGLGVDKNYEKAKELYEQVAEMGNSSAINNLGWLYQNGLGVDKNYEKAKELHEQAAEMRNSSAVNSLGWLYQKGLGVEKDYEKAKELYEQAAEMGNSSAINNLGYLYQKGLGVDKNYEKAKELYEQTAEMGDSNALMLLYELGNLFRKNNDYKRTVECYYGASKFENIGSFDSEELSVILFEFVQECWILRKQLKQKQNYIDELNARPPNLGGPEYENAKERFYSF